MNLDKTNLGALRHPHSNVSQPASRPHLPALLVGSAALKLGGLLSASLEEGYPRKRNALSFRERSSFGDLDKTS